MAKILLLSCTHNKPADKFTSAVGKLMVNCGLLETLSVSWLKELGENRLSEEEINCFKKKTFKSRKDKLLGLVRIRISDRKFQKNLKSTWTKTEDVMTFRNSIAHASLVEVPGKKKVFYDQKNNRKVTIQEINPVIDQCSKIIDELNSLWVKLPQFKN